MVGWGVAVRPSSLPTASKTTSPLRHRQMPLTGHQADKPQKQCGSALPVLRQPSVAHLGVAKVPQKRRWGRGWTLGQRRTTRGSVAGHGREPTAREAREASAAKIAGVLHPVDNNHFQNQVTASGRI